MLLRRNFIKSICVLLLFAGPVEVVEQKTETVPMRLWYDRPATNWMTSALPIGNGELGALFFGGVESEQILFNEKTLWTGSTTTRGAYQKFGDVWIHFDGQEDVREYRRELSLDEAIGKVSYTSAGTHYLREYFASRPDEVIVLRLSTPKAGKKLNFSVSLADGRPGTRQEITKDGILFRRKLDLLSYEAQLKVINEGGTLVADSNKLCVNAANSVLILLTAATNYDLSSATYVGETSGQLHKRLTDRLARASAKGYDQLKSTHLNDYQSLFNRVRFDLRTAAKTGGKIGMKTEIPSVPTNELVRLHKEALYLDMLYFQYGRYLMIASSRGMNLPNNLQGIWNGDNAPPWECDIHSNINIQMNYWPACSTNLNECVLPLIDFIRTLVKPGEKTAQAYFGARGWTASISGNIFGFTTPLESQDMSWNFNPMAGPWLATHIWEYYDYTRDLTFLKETGYELIKSSADFAVDYLWHKPDGTYTAAPSTSPEHGPIDQGATFVHAVVREILLDAIEASKVLGVDKKERKQWEHVLANLVPYKIGRYGQLMEWSVDIDDPKDEHRHVNHLFGLHPGHTVSPVTTPELAKAAKVVLVHRGDGATGWSMGWKLNQWARLQDGNHAYTLFGNLLKNGTLDNLWDTHSPFQIDGNFGGTAGITEMLLQSHMGFIQLLPALPDAWKGGAVSGICAKGNFEVDMVWENNQLKEAVVHSNAGGNCVIKYADKTLSFKTVKGRSYRIEYDVTKGLIRQ